MPKTKARKGRTSKPRKTKAPAPPKPLIRTSELTAHSRCDWQWARSYVDGLTAIREAPALRFGTLIHAALEKRYPKGIKRGPKPAETFEKLYTANLKEVEDKWGFRDADGEWAEAGELGVNMLEHYVDVYGRDEEWRVIASEMTFKVPVYGHQREDGLWIAGEKGDDAGSKLLFYYVGTMDGVWQNRMDNGVRINDYKTTSGDPVKEASAKMVLDPQGTAYWTYGVDFLESKGILKPREQEALDGMLYTFLRKAKKDTRKQNKDGHYLNQDGTVSKRQPGPYFHRELVYRDDQQQTRARHRAVAQFQIMQAQRNGELPVLKSPGLSFPDQQCKACEFFDLCELHEIGADWETLRDSTMTEWDPYDAHEIAEEGKR